MNTTSHKIPILWGTIALVMGLLYACTDADADGGEGSSFFSCVLYACDADGGGDSDPLTLTAGDITYASVAVGTADEVTPQSSKINDFSGLTFSIDLVSPYVGTETHNRPTIAKNGTITVAADTSSGSYRVTITPDGSTILGDPFTVDFYVTVKATNTKLDTTLQQVIKDYGLTGDFNYIDTSAVVSMSYLFASGYEPRTGVEKADRIYVKDFNGDISKWDVSAVEDFSAMFYNATAFNQNIGGWNVSAGIRFSGMFNLASVFNQDIGDWVVSDGENFGAMFAGAVVFNQDISGWTVSSGTNFAQMFVGATAFNQDLSSWMVQSTATTTNMFSNSGVVNPESYTWYP